MPRRHQSFPLRHPPKLVSVPAGHITCSRDGDPGRLVNLHRGAEVRSPREGARSQLVRSGMYSIFALFLEYTPETHCIAFALASA